MEVKSVGKFIRVSTRKARIPANIVKGMKATEAVAVLKYMQKGSAKFVLKVLESAIADAVHNFGLVESSLVISDVTIDKGPGLRRVIYKAKGSVAFYNRPMSHITVKVSTADFAVKQKKTSKKETQKVKAIDKKVVESKKVAKKATAKTKVTK